MLTVSITVNASLSGQDSKPVSQFAEAQFALLLFDVATNWARQSEGRYRKNWKAIPGKQVQSMAKNRTEVCSPPILRFDPCSSCIAWLCEASRCLRGGWRCWQRMSSAAGLRQQHQRNQRLGLARRRLGFASPDEELHKKRESFLGKDVRSYHRICRLKQLTVHFSCQWRPNGLVAWCNDMWFAEHMRDRIRRWPWQDRSHRAAWSEGSDGWLWGRGQGLWCGGCHHLQFHTGAQSCQMFMLENVLGF